MKLLTPDTLAADGAARVLSPDNTVDVTTLDLSHVERIDLQFPKFTDGRAFSQAVALRRRAGYRGTLRAVGDVLVDQLLQMQRCGFDEAVLAAGQSLAHGQRQLQRFDGFYQGDAQQPAPVWLQASAGAPA